MNNVVKFPPRKITISISDAEILESKNPELLIQEKLLEAGMPADFSGFITEHRKYTFFEDSTRYTWSSDLHHV